METHPEFLRHDGRVLIDRSDIIFAHCKQSAYSRVSVQRVAHLNKKIASLLPTFRVGSKQLFELVENCDTRLGQSLFVNRLLTALQEFTQGHSNKLLSTGYFGRPLYERIENIDVRDLGTRKRW